MPSNRVGKWLFLAAVVCVAVGLHWVAAYLILVVGVAASEQTASMSFLADGVIVSLLLTPLVSIGAVILAAFRFCYSQRWITIGALGLMPVWTMVMGGIIWYFWALNVSS